MFKKYFFIIIPILLIIIGLLFWITPFLLTKNNVFNWYTTISDPKDFNYGVNIDSTRQYSSNICWNSLFSLSPRYIVVANDYQIDGEYDTDVHLIQYTRNAFDFWNLKPDKLFAFSDKKSHDEIVKNTSYWCSQSPSSETIYRTYDYLMKLKQDAIDHPKQTQEEKDRLRKEYQQAHPEEFQNIQSSSSSSYLSFPTPEELQNNGR